MTSQSIKHCLICKVQMKRRKRESQKQWNEKRTCGDDPCVSELKSRTHKGLIKPTAPGVFHPIIDLFLYVYGRKAA